MQFIPRSHIYRDMGVAAFCLIWKDECLAYWGDQLFNHLIIYQYFMMTVQGEGQ